MDKKRKRFFYDAALVLLVCAAVVSGGAYLLRLAEKRNNDAAFDALSEEMDARTGQAFIRQEENTGDGGGGRDDRDAAVSGEPDGARSSLRLTPDEAVELRRARLEDYRALAAQNPDMVGWVTIPGTKIDYPVMQTADRPDYYLRRNFDRQRSAYGVPYAAEDCDLTGGCADVIVYGHHMKDGSMFAALSGYTQREFYEEHPWFWFDTLEETGLYQIIGVCTADAAGDSGDGLFGMARAENKQEYGDYVGEIKRRSFYDTGVSASWGEPLVTLMTCEYTTREGRLLVVGKRYDSGTGKRRGSIR